MVKKLLLVFVSVVVLAGGWFAFQRYGIPYLSKSKTAVPVAVNNSWWKYGGNAQNNFTSVGKGFKGKVAWTHQASASIYESPAIGADGTIYFQCQNGKAYALDDKSGKVKWESKVSKLPFWRKAPDVFHLQYGPSKAIVTPAVSPYNLVYFPAIDGNLYALDGATGKRKWVFNGKRNPPTDLYLV